MKETVSDPNTRPSADGPNEPPKETPHERKRRLARDRQRRHREKLRRNAAAIATTSDGPARPTTSPHRSAKPVSTSQQSDDSVEPSLRDVRAGHSVSGPSRQPSAISPGDNATAMSVHVVGERGPASKPVVRATSRAVRPDTQPPAPIRRSDRHAIASPSNGMPDSPNEQRTLRRQVQPHPRQVQPQQSPPTQTQQSQQQLIQQQQEQEQLKQLQTERQQQQHQEQQEQQQHKRLQQQQQSRDMLDPREAQARQESRQLRAHQQQQQKIQQQRQAQFNQNLLIQQQPNTFAQQTHGFSATTQPQPSQVQQPDSGFGFAPQGDVSNVQSQYVTAEQRAYLPDPPTISLAVQTRAFARPVTHHRTEQQAHALAAADAAAGLTALPVAVNGMHGGIGIGSSVGHPSGGNASPTGLGIAQVRYVTGNAGTGGVQQSSPQGEGRSDFLPDMYAHNPRETPEERKRRLARERQRRRRKRLKGDPDAAKEIIAGLPRSEDEPSRDVPTPNVVVVASNNLGLAAQVRAADAGVHSHSQGQVGPGIAPPFEAGGLASGHQVQSALTPMHVGGVGGSHDELGSGSGNRAGFSAHTMGAATGMGTGVPSSSGGLIVAPQAIDLQRFQSTNSEVKEVAVQNESPEQRKRRLARDRQRRRRSRLKRDKMVLESSQKSPSSSQGLKSGGEGPSGRLAENVEQRMGADLERRVMTNEGVAESERMPIGSPGSAVFGGRADVGQSLSFGEQQRGLRGSSSMGDGVVQGMGMNFATGNPLGNLQVQVGGIGATMQAQGGLMHWSQAFDSETSARFAVESAVSAFRAQLGSISPSARAYVMQHGLMQLSGSEDGSRDIMNGAMMSTLRADGVIRM